MNDLGAKVQHEITEDRKVGFCFSAKTKEVLFENPPTCKETFEVQPLLAAAA